MQTYSEVSIWESDKHLYIHLFGKLNNNFLFSDLYLVSCLVSSRALPTKLYFTSLSDQPEK